MWVIQNVVGLVEHPNVVGIGWWIIGVLMSRNAGLHLNNTFKLFHLLFTM
jgi:hypothetical protein